MCGCRHFCISEVFCEPLYPLWEGRAIGLPMLDCYPLISSLFWCLVMNRASFLVPDRHFALLLNLKMDLMRSCGCDVEDELALELDDNPGTTGGTKFSVLQRIFFPCLVRCGFWPLVHSWEYPWSSQSFSSDRTAGVSLGICTVTKRSRSWTYTGASSFVCTSPLAVTTVVVFLDLGRVSISSELGSFLLSMCVDALGRYHRCGVPGSRQSLHFV